MTTISRRIAVALIGAGVFATLAPLNSAHAADQGADLLKRYVAAFNAHDPGALAEIVAEDYLQHNGRAGQGLVGLQSTARQYFQTFPDFHMELDDSVTSGDKVVARFTLTATHDHPVQLGPSTPLFPPTGKKLTWQGISIWRIANGKFVEHWDVDDLLSLAQQMRGTSG